MTIDELVDVLSERHTLKKRQLDLLLQEVRRVQSDLSSIRDELKSAEKTQLAVWKESARKQAVELEETVSE